MFNFRSCFDRFSNVIETSREKKVLPHSAKKKLPSQPRVLQKKNLARESVAKALRREVHTFSTVTDIVARDEHKNHEEVIPPLLLLFE